MNYFSKLFSKKKNKKNVMFVQKHEPTNTVCIRTLMLYSLLSTYYKQEEVQLKLFPFYVD